MKKLSLLIVLIFAIFQIMSAEDAEAYKGTKGLEYSFNEESKTAFLTGRGTVPGGQTQSHRYL